MLYAEQDGCVGLRGQQPLDGLCDTVAGVLFYDQFEARQSIQKDAQCSCIYIESPGQARDLCRLRRQSREQIQVSGSSHHTSRLKSSNQFK